jgi:hypothetical protein
MYVPRRLYPSPLLQARSASRQQIYDDQNQGDDQKQMNQSAADMYRESDEPEHEENDDDCPQKAGHEKNLRPSIG